ncbi:MAG: hypothetical protein GX308_08865 [Epulopiscium sp.]|nr:hypothetical protein [Candidatus Epulonipiscium sp.]
MIKRKKNKKAIGFGWNTFFIILFFSIIALKTYDLQKINRGLIEQKNEYQKKIYEQNEEKSLLLEEKEYNQSDRYIEKVAREKLGLVKEDEIVFMEMNENEF